MQRRTEARAFLENLAQGAPDSMLTRTAKSGLTEKDQWAKTRPMPKER
jgi:hypothetical protein